MAERCVVKVLGKGATSFAACFYNEQKVAQGTAKCIQMRNFGDLEKYFIHSPVVVSNYLQKIADHNSMVKQKQKHMVFSFPGKATPEEEQQLLKDAAETMDRLGYKDQPQIFWVHNDTKNTHIHVASVTVSVKDGMWIDNWMEGRRARRILDNVRGINYKSEIDKLFDYKFESREQFKSLLIANGYRSHLDEESGSYDIFRNHDLVGSIPVQELDRKIEANGKNKENHKDIVVDLRGKLMDNRRRSLKQKFGEPIEVATKKGKHTVTKQLVEVKGNRFNGEKGIDIEGERKAQFKQFLIDLKQKLGISIVFSQWKDGQTKGYTIIDNKNKMVFKGSDVVDLQKLLNPEWKKGMEKDTVISANDASSMADEISMDKNLPQFIEQHLEKLGIEVDYDKEEAMNDYGSETEQENRDTSIMCLNLLINMIAEQEDLTKEGENDIRDLAKEAIGRAVCADGLHLLEEERKAREKAEEEARRGEEEKMKARSKARSTMTGDKVAQYVADILDDYGISYNPAGRVQTDTKKENIAILSALDFLEEAVSAARQNTGKAQWLAELAIGNARLAEELHNKADSYTLPSFATEATIDKVITAVLKDLGYPDMKVGKIPVGFDLKDYPADQYATLALEFLKSAYKTSGLEQKEKLKSAMKAANMAHEQLRRQSGVSQGVARPATRPVAPKFRPINFTDFAAKVISKDGKYYISATVAGKDMEKMLSAGHYAWYQREPNRTDAARGLALHYFSQELYLAKREEYKKQCISRGYLPYGMKLVNEKTLITSIYGRINYPNGDWDDNCSHKYSQKDRLPGETDKQLFIRMFGSEEADRFWDCSFGDIKEYFFNKPSGFSEDSAIGETLAVFNDVAAAFNDSAAAMMGFVLGNDIAYVPSCGGGGGPGSGWRGKKDDDDLRNNPRGLFARPIKSKGLHR